MSRRVAFGLILILLSSVVVDHSAVSSVSLATVAMGAEDANTNHAADAVPAPVDSSSHNEPVSNQHASPSGDYWTLLFVFALSTLIGLGVIERVSRLLHTPLMSLTNAISAIAVVGAIIVAGGDHPTGIRVLGFIALSASMTNIVSGFMITDRMLKMFKQPGKGAKP